MNSSWSKETRGERRARHIILTIVIAIVAVSFYYQSQKFEQINTSNKSATDFKPLVSVIQQTSGREKPIIAIVKKYEEKPILILYSINIRDRYKFEVIKTVELQDYPEQIVAVPETGFWLYSDNDWQFFDMELQSRPQKAEEVIVSTDHSITFKSVAEKETTRVTAFVDGQKAWEQTFNDSPISIHSLAITNDIWLIAFENDFIIYESGK